MRAEELHDRTYWELHALAQSHFNRDQAVVTLQPTALLHEVYMRLSKNDNTFVDREHFLATAARAMRQVLVDHARARGAQKRGGGASRVELDTLECFEERAGDLLALDEALEQLAQEDEQLARIVEMRFFAGLTEEAVATEIGVSRRSVTKGFQVARNWLADRLRDDA